MIGDGSALPITHTGSANGASILKGPTKNGIYEWPSSIVAFTTTKSSAID